MKLAYSFATTLTLLVVSSAVASTTGCAVDADTNADDSTAESELSASSNSGYFRVVRRDTRRCPSPTCGGLFVKRVNEAKTQCADGSRQAECYVASVDLGGMGLSGRDDVEFREAFESGRALIKAKTFKTTSPAGTFGVLKVQANEGWVAKTGATPASLDSASFYRVADRGLRCKTAPCPSLTASGLNGAYDYNLVEVGFESLGGADADTVAHARRALHTSQGVLVAGVVALPKCAAGVLDCGPFLMPTEIFARVVPQD